MTLLTARSHMLSIQAKKKVSRNRGENSGINGAVNCVNTNVDECNGVEKSFRISVDKDISKGVDEDVSEGVDGNVFARLVAYSSDQVNVYTYLE